MAQAAAGKLVPGNSLITATAEEGRALAITLARHSIQAMQHDEDVLKTGRAQYANDPHWLIAADNARLDPARKPFWLADEYVPKGIIPWCLSWKVNEIRYGDGRVFSSTEKAISSVE